MNTQSHILMGNFLYQYIKKQYGINLNKRSFLIGNVLPDYSPSFLSRPHFLKHNVHHLQKNIQKLTDPLKLSLGNDKKISRKLGILCHFYADFFCHAHTVKFKGSLRDHIKYEDELQVFFETNYQTICHLVFITNTSECSNAEDVYTQFQHLQKTYLNSVSSMSNDLCFCILACIDAIVHINNTLCWALNLPQSCRY